MGGLTDDYMRNIKKGVRLMNSISEILPLLETLIKGLSKHFGDKCELVVHDYSIDFSSSIVAIENGHITGRSVGKGGTDIGLKIIQGTQSDDGRFHYASQTRDGRRLLSSTINLKDDNGKILGSLCINYDVTDFLNTRNHLDQFLGETSTTIAPAETTVFEDVEDMLVSMIKDSLDIIGTPVALMTREQKIEGIQYLNRRGAFKIKNAINVVAKYYDVSRYTMYNYINDGQI